MAHCNRRTDKDFALLPLGETVDLQITFDKLKRLSDVPTSFARREMIREIICLKQLCGYVLFSRSDHDVMPFGLPLSNGVLEEVYVSWMS